MKGLSLGAEGKDGKGVDGNPDLENQIGTRPLHKEWHLSFFLC